MKIFAIVTGASRGFGYSIVKELIKKTLSSIPDDSVSISIDFNLYARTLSNLESTASMIKAFTNNSTNININIRSFAIDFGSNDIESSESSFRKSLENIEFNQYDKVIFFNNHGSLSILDRVDSLYNFQQISKDVNSNLTSFILTNSIFVSLIKQQNNPILDDTSFFLINISSLAAIKSYETWSIYCSCKAAREMFTQTLNLESKTITNFKILNYAPGPMDTDMQSEIRSKTIDQQSKQYWVDLKDSGKLVDPFDSASKLMSLIFNNTFESASHIDYYDD